ncbi:uncharacterized protein Z519_11493 [Cladophialophora bantiana CBS 173.52]|uniref:Uncharacterized protein n=1 Tax=Cladophialophora bantiana (strain ATCC 10958 / CBS 173.52 / CDC B-1940 / NIH 8579) TaxID=1442370 RepID=A0A0D2H3L9_CLAB1|nr:uncharacterized protein Z519_11493 [Cladophialophora bantiana CBS 173.52]KIW87908.1 hypothetical protein Z519_11493 [Cladophialophora bantiana CBS 173.52]
MSGKYSVEDLLKLRASPLICKPPNLPPIEEWMGAQELSGRRPITRGVKDEQPVQSEPFQKRPTLIDAHRRTATDPDRIVLGPPRRSFASSNARAVGKTQDLGEDTGNHKDRSAFNDRSRNGDESEPRHHERRYTQTNGRYSSRQEGEDPETEGRRDYDRRPKWAGRDRNEDQENDQTQDDSSRGFRRDTQSRAKLSQSWFKKDTGDAEDDKTPDWRRDRGRDRDWDKDRPAKVEAEPEWMDSTEPEEPFQARTQEDFQRWKERMKAGSTASVDKVETAATSPPPEEKPAKRVVSTEPDDSMDKFFARFESKATEQKAGPAKSHGKTRFASLFSPATEQNRQIDAPAQPPSSERPSSAQATGSATDADQAGFARILEMLQTRSNNPTPQNQEALKPRTPLYARSNEQKSEPEAKPPTPTLYALLSGQLAGQPQQPEQIQLAAPQERYTESKSPIEQPTHTRQQSSITKDEVLLSLLRQASLAPKPQPPPPAGGGMFVLPPDPGNRAVQPRGPVISPIQAQQDPTIAQRREPRGPMFEESPVSMYQSEQVPREQPGRRPTNGTQSLYSEDPLIAMLRGQAPPQRPMQPPRPPQVLPPGLQRPPGLDQMTRQNPSWPPQQPQQPQPSRQPSLPPGLPNLPRGMSGAPYGQPQQIPSQQALPQQQRPQQPQPQRKYTADSSGMPPNLPPGMYPPPGFMNAGPPPGFPGALANHPASRFGGDPGAQQRAFMEMYGEVGGRGLGLRGGAGSSGMPPYR